MSEVVYVYLQVVLYQCACIGGGGGGGGGIDLP